MDGTPFASLAQIRILLLPVGSIRRSVFDKYAGLVRTLEHIRLGDVPPDQREDRNRFIPSPLSAGSLHLHYTTHPPSAWHQSFSLLRLSSFPLAVIGIADCSQNDSLPALAAEFKAALAAVFPITSATPFTSKCFAFEDGDAIPDVNVGPAMPELVMIPSLMSNKQVYIGTLLGELCHDILAEFPSLVRAIDNPEGIEALNTNLLPSLSKYADGSGYFVHGPHRHHTNGVGTSRHSAPTIASRLSAVAGEANGKPIRSSSPAPGMINGNTNSTGSSLLNISASSKKRVSALGPSNGRLAKVVGDLYLLAGKLSDASYWYSEAISLFRTQQDSIWNASALEGQCTVEMLEAWSLGDGLHTSLGGNTLADPWANISDKMGQAINLYSRATPLNPSPAPDPELASIVLLYTEAILRYARLLFAVWAGKGWNPASLSTLLSTGLPPSFTPEPSSSLSPLSPSSSHYPSVSTTSSTLPTSTLFRLTSLTGITRAQIAGVASQAHGPFLAHLQPSDRIRVLSALAALYACLGFRRKEAFVLREVQAGVMDLVVCGRDEARLMNGSAGKRRPDSVNSEPDTPTGTASNGNGNGVQGGGQGTQLSVRRTESQAGNASVIRMARYVAQVYGVDLGRVGVADSVSAAGKRRSATTGLDALPELGKGDARYGWPELQVGVVREALAVAEALPDHVAVAQFSLSTLRALHEFITVQEQQHLSASATRAIAVSRRRGIFQSMEFWFEQPLLAIDISPIPLSRLPSEHPRSDLRLPGESAAPEALRSFMIYDPRGKKRATALRLVQNENVEFSVTLQNPFLFDLEVPSIYLSTSGVEFQSQHTSTTIPASSTHTVTLSGIALETGTLTIRGCFVQLPGGLAREFILPLPPSASASSNPRISATPSLKISHSPYDAERIKFTGLESNHLLRPSDQPERNGSGTNSLSPPPRFLQYQVVPEQPLLRIRRSSIAHGSLMLYDGESSEIRITVENISNVPVDFYKLSCDDSTIAPAQQLLAEGELSVADAYEMEHDLVHRPFFRWTAPDALPPIPPGKRLVVPVQCHGKVGCSQGSIQMSYSYVHRDQPSSSSSSSSSSSPTSPSPSSPPDTFHARQIAYPVNITVYHTLEFSNLDIIPLSSSSSSSLPSSTPAPAAQTPSSSSSSLSLHTPHARNDLTTTLASIPPGQNDYCLVSVDVNNIYGLPFDVTLERHQDNAPPASITRTVAPGCTSRLFLPIRRIMLPESHTTRPIPSLSDRQFVVAKDKLSDDAERVQRELFWYREKLFEVVKARWVEPATGRTGTLELRSQRFTMPMRGAMRREAFPVDVAFVAATAASSSSSTPDPPARMSDLSFPFSRADADADVGGSSAAVKRGNVWHVRVYEILKLVVTARNHCTSPKSLSMSVGTVHPTPPDLALFEGRQSNNFLGTLPPSSDDDVESLRGSEASKSVGVCFVAEGTFDILVEVVEVDEYGLPLPWTEKNATSKTVKVVVHGEEE